MDFGPPRRCLHCSQVFREQYHFNSCSSSELTIPNEIGVALDFSVEFLLTSLSRCDQTVVPGLILVLESNIRSCVAFVFH
jgi:hypothetical protein